MEQHFDGRTKQFARGPASDVWRHTLAQIETTFGRLVYLASLRNQNTGRYEHFGLEQMYGEEEAGRTLLESHRHVLSEWLCFGLEQQKNEVASYLDGLDDEPRLVLESWSRFSPYRNFLPAGTRESERDLYLSDLELVLQLLRRERGAAEPDPEP